MNANLIVSRIGFENRWVEIILLKLQLAFNYDLFSLNFFINISIKNFLKDSKFKI
jgi:hypothetical protein